MSRSVRSSLVLYGGLCRSSLMSRSVRFSLMSRSCLLRCHIFTNMKICHIFTVSIDGLSAVHWCWMVPGRFYQWQGLSSLHQWLIICKVWKIFTDVNVCQIFTEVVWWSVRYSLVFYCACQIFTYVKVCQIFADVVHWSMRCLFFVFCFFLNSNVFLCGGWGGGGGKPRQTQHHSAEFISTKICPSMEKFHPWWWPVRSSPSEFQSLMLCGGLSDFLMPGSVRLSLMSPMYSGLSDFNWSCMVVCQIFTDVKVYQTFICCMIVCHSVRFSVMSRSDKLAVSLMLWYVRFSSMSRCVRLSLMLFGGMGVWWSVRFSLMSPPKGGRGCLMSPPCLESQGCHLIPLCYLLSCSSV